MIDNSLREIPCSSWSNRREGGQFLEKWNEKMRELLQEKYAQGIRLNNRSNRPCRTTKVGDERSG